MRANARRLDDDVDAARGEVGAGADSGLEQEERGIHSAAADDDLLPRPHDFRRAAL